jgi:hypothetical protein
VVEPRRDRRADQGHGGYAAGHACRPPQRDERRQLRRLVRPQHVGLGDATRIAAIEVLWPATGESQRLAGVEMGRRYRIREGEPRAVPVP